MRLFSITLALLVGSGCGTSHRFVHVAAPPHQLLTRSPSQVTVFTSDKPTLPYREIGIIESQQESRYSEDNAAAVLDKMRAYAGLRGCDALVIVASHDASGVSAGNGKTALGYRGTCLVYTQPSAASKRDTGAPACVANTSRSCDAEYGCLGSQRCVESGMGYTLCECQAQNAIPLWVGSP